MIAFKSSPNSLWILCRPGKNFDVMRHTYLLNTSPSKGTARRPKGNSRCHKKNPKTGFGQTSTGRGDRGRPFYNGANPVSSSSISPSTSPKPPEKAHYLDAVGVTRQQGRQDHARKQFFYDGVQNFRAARSERERRNQGPRYPKAPAIGQAEVRIPGRAQGMDDKAPKQRCVVREPFVSIPGPAGE